MLCNKKTGRERMEVKYHLKLRLQSLLQKTCLKLNNFRIHGVFFLKGENNLLIIQEIKIIFVVKY